LPDSYIGGKGKAYSWITYSDARIKSAQRDIDYGLLQIMKLKPKRYFQHSSIFENNNLSIKEEGENTIGLIAQEVYKIIPEAVQKPENESKELWSMNYEKLTPVLIKGMQEQQQQINELKEIVKAQNRKIEEQNKRIEQLMKLVSEKK